MSGISAVTAATVGASLVWGLVLALWGTLKRSIPEQPPPRSRPAALAAAVNAALIPLALLCGVLTDRLQAPLMLMAGCVTLAAALIWLSTRPTWPRDLAAVLLAALGGSAVSIAALVLMPQAFFGPAEAMASVALGSVFVALGALVGSTLVDVLLAALGRKRALALLAFVCLVPAFPAAVAMTTKGSRPNDVAVLLEHGDVWLAALVFFLYAPLEAAVGLWTTTTLAGAEDEKGRGGRLVAGFWVAFLASRLAMAAVQHQGWLSPSWETWLPVLPALLVAVVLGNLAGAGVRVRRRLGVWLLGAFLGPVFPALAGYVLRRLAGEAGAACGLLFAAGSLGCLLGAPLGRPDPGRTPAAALRMTMFLALGLMVVSLVFALTAS
jgi:hypothetical protein